MIDKLLSKLKDINITNSSNPSASTSAQSKTSSQKKPAPQKSINISTRTPVKAPTRAASEPLAILLKSKASVKPAPVQPLSATPPRRQLHQVFTSEYPKGFNKTKVMYTHFLCCLHVFTYF
ncbi:hypothetical protein CROQUDRAFT_36930 [Cronartium quercuum f. sp. fusiforme G11]|uniref:Uncharacterized protein n=1 Tax=Cronartium quercuum f. sp. fusiforme G11 TaxID=708437 RepID=A0A9P6NVY5_9BASI|nr:hypothetical protein CROQUDRAFT_36930 [Cronartium quercuum f. sp. fusiforme G11]